MRFIAVIDSWTNLHLKVCLFSEDAENPPTQDSIVKITNVYPYKPKFNLTNEPPKYLGTRQNSL